LQVWQQNSPPYVANTRASNATTKPSEHDSTPHHSPIRPQTANNLSTPGTLVPYQTTARGDRDNARCRGRRDDGVERLATTSRERASAAKAFATVGVRT
jgi:hypothetical protein